MMRWLPDAIAILVCAVAFVTDTRRLRIPNAVTYTAIGCGIALNAALGVDSLLAALLGAALGLFVFGIPAAMGLVGMGDVKLMIALGALVRWPLALPLALYVVLAGGVVALGYVAAGRRLSDRMPYGVAIGIGCCWAVASRYLPELRLLDF